MPTRRAFLAAGGALGLSGAGRFAASPARAEEPQPAMETRPIPSSGERLPVIGLGSSGSFDVSDSAAERPPLREVLTRFFAGGGKVVDTAPSYGTAEAVIGDLLEETKLRPQAFLATKISVSGREAGEAQFRSSLARLRTDRVELLQIHNLIDWRAQAALARDLKARGLTRYVGLTHYLETAHEALAEAMAEAKPDFIQINYSVVARGAETRLFPLAQSQGVAVLVNRAFDDGRLFARVKDRPLPGWAAEAGVGSWAQAFLKFALSQDAVTAVIPATGKPERLSDNLRAGFGPPLDAAQRKSLIDIFA